MKPALSLTVEELTDFFHKNYWCVKNFPIELNVNGKRVVIDYSNVVEESNKIVIQVDV